MRAFLLIAVVLVFFVVGNLDGSPQQPRVKRSIRMKQSEYKFLVKSCNPGTVVGTVEVVGANPPILFVLDAPSPNIATGIRNGQLTLINYLQPGTTYSVTVRATNPSGSSSAVVHYGCLGQGPLAQSSFQSAARFTQPTYVIKNSVCSAGSIVGGVQAIGVPGQPCVYSMTSPQAAFSIHPTTGQIILKGSPNGPMSLAIRADCPGASAPATTTAIVDLSCARNPVFHRQFYDFQLQNCNGGQFVGTVSATDATTYSIDPFTNTGGNFLIVPSTGEIRSKALLTSPVYKFVVKAQSSSGASSTVQVQVRTSCSAPKIIQQTALKFDAPSYNFSPRNCKDGVIVGKVTAVGGNGPVMYAVNNPTSPLAYRIGATTGGIFAVGRPVAGTLIIQATNGGSSISVPVTIATDRCENPPIQQETSTPMFSQDSYFFETRSCKKGAPIGSVFASSGLGVPVRYSLRSPSPVVALEWVSGILTVAADLTGSRGIAGTTTRMAVLADNGVASREAWVSIHLNCGMSNGNGAPLGEQVMNVSEPMPNEFPAGAELGNVVVEEKMLKTNATETTTVKYDEPVFIDDYVYICRRNQRCIDMLNKLDVLEGRIRGKIKLARRKSKDTKE